MRHRMSGFLAVGLLAAIAGLPSVAAAMPAPRKGSARDWSPSDAARSSTQLDPEIAEHNAKVEQRRAEKLARKRSARGQSS